MSKKNTAIYNNFWNKTTYIPTCHVGFSEVYKNLFVGGIYNIDDVLDKNILVPLDKLDGDIWKKGFYGEIYYVPIEDFSVLPSEIESRVVDYIVLKLKEGKSIAIFCLGGHGRTGYIASLVLYRLGVTQDPIGYLRNKYCIGAVETNVQIQRISDVLDDITIFDRYKVVKPIYATKATTPINFIDKCCYTCDNYMVTLALCGLTKLPKLHTNTICDGVYIPYDFNEN